MRRVLVSCVYIEDGREYRPGIVELYEQRVVNYYPLTDDDLASSEFLGGAIFLSGEEPDNLPDNATLEELKAFFYSSDEPRCYAYHLPIKWVESGELIPASSVSLLEDDDY